MSKRCGFGIRAWRATQVFHSAGYELRFHSILVRRSETKAHALKVTQDKLGCFELSRNLPEVSHCLSPREAVSENLNITFMSYLRRYKG